MIMEYLISKSSYYFGQYKINIIDWLMLNNDMSLILEITYAWLIVAKVFYELIGKLIKDFSHIENFKALVIQCPLFTKIVKTPTSLFLDNDSYSCFFGFVKFSPLLKVIQALSLLSVISIIQTLLLSLICCISHFGGFSFMKDFSPFKKIKKPF